MDLYNNLIGFLLAETRINLDSYSDATIFIRAESWTDDGKGKRIDQVDGVLALTKTSNTEKN